MQEETAIPQFEPWKKYVDLKQDRLSIVADIFCKVRHEAVLAHVPDRGDTNWGLGTRVYERTCFELRSQSPRYAEWLSILPETRSLQFSFAIGAVPFRFYRGKPDDPPDRFTIQSYGELHHQQMCLELGEGMRPPDNVLRLAVETSPLTLEVSSVSVVEVDTAGNSIGVYSIPLTRSTQVTSITQSKPVELAPPQIEPLTDIKEVAEEERHNAQKAKSAKTDIGS